VEVFGTCWVNNIKLFLKVFMQKELLLAMILFDGLSAICWRTTVTVAIGPLCSLHACPSLCYLISIYMGSGLRGRFYSRHYSLSKAALLVIYHYT